MSWHDFPEPGRLTALDHAHLRLSTSTSTVVRTGLETSAGLEVDAMRNDSIRQVACLDESEARFSLRGEFDIFNKCQLSTALEPYMASRTLSVDLADATFIDASTLGVFVHVARRRRELGAKRLRILNVSTHFRHIFSLCQLDDAFEIENVAAPKSKPRFSVMASQAVTAAA